MVCRISCATMTSWVRSPPGSGVSETRIVSPMPCCSSTPIAGGRGDDALAAHAGFGQAEMQRVVAARGEIAIDGDQVLHAADLGADHDHVGAKPNSSARCALPSAETTIASRITSIAASGSACLRVLVHHARQQILVEAAPIHADAHRLVVAAGDLDHLGELRIALAAAADVAGIDAQLGERLGAGGWAFSSLWPLKWKSPTRGTRIPAGVERSRMRGTAAAASSLLTVMRTSSEPARASADLRDRASTSAVSVLVIDCTTIGALPPTVTEPILTLRDFLRRS
jgi:hypothetical protein